MEIRHYSQEHLKRGSENWGIKVIVTNSPQAEGRVERICAVNSIVAANEVLHESFVETLNATFAKPPIDPEGALVA